MILIQVDRGDTSSQIQMSRWQASVTKMSRSNSAGTVVYRFSRDFLQRALIALKCFVHNTWATQERIYLLPESGPVGLLPTLMSVCVWCVCQSTGSVPVCDQLQTGGAMVWRSGRLTGMTIQSQGVAVAGCQV